MFSEPCLVEDTEFLNFYVLKLLSFSSLKCGCISCQFSVWSLGSSGANLQQCGMERFKLESKGSPLNYKNVCVC